MLKNNEKQYFVGIGPGKTGTTWIDKFLRKHPEVWMPPVKELHYFDRELISKRNETKFYEIKRVKRLINWLEGGLKQGLVSSDFSKERFHWLSNYVFPEKIDLNWYRSLFLPDDKHSAFGEITPGYCHLSIVRMENIKDAFSNAKVIVTVRNPACRIWSHIKFHRDNGKKLFKNDNELAKLVFQERYLSESRYDDVIKKADLAFGIGNVHVVFFEDLFSNQALNNDTIENLCDFINIKYIPTSSVSLNKKSNQSSEGTLKKDIRMSLNKHFRPVGDFLKNRTGHLPDSWFWD